MWAVLGRIVSDNEFSSQELPRSIAAVGSNAKILDATNNRLRDIESLESLVNLQRLILARNQISDLPASIAALQNLKASSAPRSHSFIYESRQMHDKESINYTINFSFQLESALCASSCDWK